MVLLRNIDTLLIVKDQIVSSVFARIPIEKQSIPLKEKQ